LNFLAGGAGVSVVAKALLLQAGSRPVQVNAYFSLPNPSDPIIRPWVYSASNRNEYKKQKNNVSEE
jgi:hypothetical protein